LGGNFAILSIDGIRADSVANLNKVRDLLTGKPGVPLEAAVLRAGTTVELTGTVS
jgi:hypothetical protein